MIALQIDTWNEERVTKATVNRYLASLVQDLKDDQNILKQVKEIHSFRVHALLYLLKQSRVPSFSFGPQKMEIVPFTPGANWEGPIPTNYNLPFIELAFNEAGRYLPMTVNTSSINELKNTGLYSSIQNTDLKKEIDQYYTDMEWVFFDAVHNESNSKWTNSLLDSGVFYLQIAELPSPLNLISKHPERVAYLKNIIAEANYRCLMAKNYFDKVEELIFDIEKEISLR